MKTFSDFIKEYRKQVNPITGEQNLFKDLTDEMVWDAAIRSLTIKDHLQAIQDYCNSENCSSTCKLQPICGCSNDNLCIVRPDLWNLSKIKEDGND